MNKLSMFLTVRRPVNLAVKNALESFLMELTAQTDITAIRSDESLGQFIYYNLTTELNDGEVSKIAHQILNNYHGDDDKPWWDRGYHPKRLRRYLIVRCYVSEYVE